MSYSLERIRNTVNNMDTETFFRILQLNRDAKVQSNIRQFMKN